MSSITTLAAAVGAVDRPGDFYASGMTELNTPKLEVEGVGLVALPVLPVRRTWQIEADRVRIKGKHWAPCSKRF